MTQPLSVLVELRALLEALCEESITPEQVRRLEALVLSHPEAEAYYVQYMSLHADLIGHFGALPARTEQSLRDRAGLGPGQSAGADGAEPAPRRRARGLLWGVLGLTGLAAGLLVAVNLWRGPPDATRGRQPGHEPSDSTVAVLLRAPGAIWEETGLPTRAGAPLPAGWLRLKSGYAHLEFYCGAIVILQGPAEFKLISRTEAFCARGKLRATVPPEAQGFTIGSPKLDLVDRGTEFGLSVGAGGTEVHVFQGKVELYDPDSGRKTPPSKELTTGQGVRLDRPGVLRPIALDPTGFLTARDLAARSQKDLLQRQRAWLAASEELRRDPSLEVYYRFEPDDPWSRTLPDLTRGHKQPRDGAIVGCAPVSGRWPGKQALEFKGVSDRVRFRVPGEFDSVTMAAWVRVYGLPNRNNSLMMTDGWEEGGLHWQIGNDGKLILGVQGRPKGRGAHYHAPDALTPQRYGQWLHLAVVYDRDGGRVTHYLDGQPLVELPLEFDIPLTIGRAELGNWNMAAHRNPTPIRFLTGCMDEFLLFSRALSGQEIERLYTQGRPPS
jgi:hypothetical protein